MGIDVLNLEWRSYPSRDRDSSTLVSNYLRYMGLSVVEGAMHNAYSLINKFNPRLVFIASVNGAGINMNVAKYVKSRGIYLVGGSAEGNFREDAVDEFTWGNNFERILLEDVWLVWSERVRDMILNHYPNMIGRLQVSGAHGFDLYKIANKAKKNITDKLVVGVGCWDFGVFDSRDTRHNQYGLADLSDNKKKFFIDDRDKFNSELIKLVKNNPKYHFILKEHPGRQLGRWASGIEGCDNYDNVTIIHTEKNIQQVISESDVWITYESTTAIEAWLMGKQTGLLNPSGIDFPMRHGLHYAQPNYKNSNEWIEALKKFTDTKKLPGFDKLKDERDRVIKDVIQWDDGLNHVRFGNAIIELLESGLNPTTFPDNVNIESISFKRRIKQSFMWKFCPYLKIIPSYKLFYENIRSKWDDNKLKEFSEKRMCEQTRFYDLSGLNKQQLRKIQVV